MNRMRVDALYSSFVAALLIAGVLAISPGCANGKAKDEGQIPEKPPEPPAVLQSAELKYEVDGKPRRGLINYWSNSINRPYLLLFPDERGLDPWFRRESEKYARMGYTVVTPDFSSITERSWDKDVVAQISAATAAALTLTRSGPAPKTGVMGFGPGGTYALTAARYLKLDAAVVCYGDLIPREEALLDLAEPILGIYGGSDALIPMTSIVAFQEAMQRTGGRFTGQVWQNEGHDFLRSPRNPDSVQEANLEIVGWLDRYLLPPG